jgi:hypothetical protein
MGKLQPSRPFSGVGPVSVMPRGCISLPVTFGTAENFRTESILFDVAEVSLPFNAILGRPALYRFMAVAHYGYLVLKMPTSDGVLRIRGDRDAGACALEKLQALAAAREAIAEPQDQSTAPPGSRRLGPMLLRLPVSRVIWTANRNSRSSPSSRLMRMCLHDNHLRCPGSLGR